MARERVAFCVRGHDIAVVGRYKTGRCRACTLKNDNPPVYIPGRRGRRKGTDYSKPKMFTGRPRAERCAKGHALTPDNRYVWRGQQKGCLTCRRADSHRYRRKAGRGQRVPRVVPAEPIWRFVERIGVKEFAASVGQQLGIQAASVERLLFRARTIGFTVDTADDLCVAIGRHPAEIFGDAWFTYGAKEVADAV